MVNLSINKLVISFGILLATVTVGASSKRYTWSKTDEWTLCSKKCGEGEERRMLECVLETPYGTKEQAQEENCTQNLKPEIKRKCVLGPCPTNSTGSFLWVTGNWTQCSRTCGGRALQNREVSCYHRMNSGLLLPSKLSKCDSKMEPERFISCAKTDCPPKFLASKWGKCPATKNCVKSVRRRNVQCTSQLSNGKYKVISAAFCYRLHSKPLPSWEKCVPDNAKHCRHLSSKDRFNSLVFSITKDEAEVYQMRSVKRLKLLVGQTAYVFTYTKLSLECPIAGYPHFQVTWSHRGQTFEYGGESTSRVRVNRRGLLIIQEFLLADVGIWRCHAGKYSADVTLKHELPSNGFHNWLKRHSNQNYEMFNEESSRGVFVPAESPIVWMKSDWSRCSVSCGTEDEGSGFQERKVSCEMVEAKYYKVIDDKLCSGPKPMMKRRCKSSISCPRWRIENGSNVECTDQCIDIGVARLNTNIHCEYETRSVDTSYCEASKRPNVTCPNNKCKIRYRYGPWSRCSLSCSNTSTSGIRSRTMHCVWHHNTAPAHNLCQHNGTPHRPLTKACRVPKCILGCHDLTTACRNQSKYRCRSSLFYHFCCAFCRRENFY